MAVKFQKKFDVGWTVAMFLYALFLLGTLVFQLTTGTILNETFYIVYVSLGAVAFLGLVGSVLYQVFDSRVSGDGEEAVATALFVSHAGPGRFLANPLSRFFVVIFLVGLTAAFVFSSGSVFQPPNPYGSEPLTKSVLEQHPLFLNMWNISVYPGFFEEAVVFFIVGSLVVALSWAFALLFRDVRLRKSAQVLVPSVLIATLFGSFVFSAAHIQAFGGNTQNLLSAFMFEFMLQLGNQLTGFFMSWIPHTVHNAAVTVKTQLAFAIGAVAPVFVPWWFRSVRVLSQDFRRWWLQDLKVFREVAKWPF